MTMNNLIIKYPLDLTGLRPENLVTNESHTAPRERARGFAPRYGAFFTKSMRIVHAATGKPLVKGVDYLALHLYEKATRATGQEICAAVQIINDDLDGEFLLTYQVVGGEFSANVSVIEELLAALALDNRPVKWGEILGLPNAFPPSAHLHDVDDLYGFEYLIEALDRIRSAILLGDYYDHEEIRQRIENLRNFLLEEDQKIIGMLDEHMRDHSNPHAVTKAQVGLGNVDNFPVASLAEAQAGTANNRYMTPERSHDLVKEKALKPLTAHINDKANPHATTKAQVGLGSVENFGVASQAEAEAGTSNSLYTTVLRVMQMITKFAVTPLSDHIADKSNPHGVTKAQVGLGSVDNYATATQAEAEAGAANNLFLTPFTGLKMIVKHAGELLAAHINNKANPHAVTKAQVGLGLVENFAAASQVEAEAGSSNSLYTTVLRVKQMIAKFALEPLNAHLNDQANPHGVTKAQVGLGSVDNFRTATQAEAEAGTANNLFLTPFTGLKMIVKHAGELLAAHINNKANPHAVTKAQVGLGSVENFPVATLVEAQAGTANNRYMTPERSHDLVKEKALKPLTAHIADKANPHGVTKAQVGLGSVDNFATATQAEAIAGTASNSFMTPLRTAEAITKQAGALLGTHIADKANPHAVTKVQVGLGNVDNFATATQLQAEAGAANNLFMTPLRTAQAITKQAGALLDAHIADKSNPHGVTKAQVGLGSVDNFATATQAEAIAGTASNRFMTPLRADELVANRLGSYVPRSWVSGGGGWSGIVGKIPTVQTNGVLEVGRYIDWHSTGEEVDYNIRYEVRRGARGWEIYNTGYYNCQDIYVRSDARDKTKIRKIDNARGIVRMLNGYYYHLHNENYETAGLIAQQLLKAFPQAVTLSSNEAGEERYVIKPSAVEGLLMQFSREIDRDVLEMVKTLTSLEVSHMAMESRIDALVRRIEVLENK